MNTEHNRPRAAVVIIAYNDETHIERAIKSVCEQTEKNIEIICVDDGSTDATYEHMCRYAERDERIKPVSQANSGAFGARYAGFGQVTSDYVLFLDSDDILMPEAVEMACGEAGASCADVLEFGVLPVKDESNLPTKETWMFLENYFSQAHPIPKADHGPALVNACFVERAITWNVVNKIYRAELLRKAFQFYQGERLGMEEDMLFTLMVLCQAERYVRIPAKLYAYTVGGGISTTGEKLTSTDALKRVATEGLTLKLAREWMNKLGCGQDEVMSGMEALTAFIRNCILNHMLSRVAAEKRGEYLQFLSQYCERDAYYDLISEAISRQQEYIERLEDSTRQQNQALGEVQRKYEEIANAEFWKMTKPFRAVMDIFKTGKRNHSEVKMGWGEKFAYLFSKGLTSLKRQGVVPTIKRVRRYLKSGYIPQYAVQEKESENLIDLEISDEYRPSQELYQRLKGKSVDIIVPIYNGVSLLPPLLESIPRTKMPYHLFLIDDNSPNQAVLPMLRDYAAKRDNVTVIENHENLGYTHSINKGFSLAKGHVVLLNTDVRLPMYWLERLMTPILTDSKVASVTPFTNSGSICSFPRFLENNDLYMGLSVDEIDTAFGRMKPQYTQIPTGVGFCMALSRDALTAVGQYDEESFPRGYGEENDWCQRAEKAGFRNVMAENLFVYHQHGATFTPEEKQKLIQKHLLLLNRKHPDYDADIQRYIRLDPAKKYRKMAQLLLFSQDAGKTPVLAFSHAWGGGSGFYLDEKIKVFTGAGRPFLTIQYFDGRGYQLSRFFDGYRISIRRDRLEQLLSFLPERLGEIWVNELVSYPNIAQVLDQIKALSHSSGARLVFRLHDFYCVCPGITLLDDSGKFCGVCDPQKCPEHCKRNKNTQAWRRMWGSFLSACDEITAFSNNSVQMLQRAYPELQNVVVIPHSVEKLRPVSPHIRGNVLTIGVIGAINEEKGLKILEQMAEIIHRGKKPMRIQIIGYTVYEPKYRSIISSTGKYERDNLPEIVEKNKIDLVLIPSIWPETFSYTTEEGMMMGLPVAVFDIGAPAERVKSYEKGIVIREISAEAAIEEINRYWENVNPNLPGYVGRTE